MNPVGVYSCKKILLDDYVVSNLGTKKMSHSLSAMVFFLHWRNDRSNLHTVHSKEGAQQQYQLPLSTDHRGVVMQL